MRLKHDDIYGNYGLKLLMVFKGRGKILISTKAVGIKETMQGHYHINRDEHIQTKLIKLWTLKGCIVPVFIARMSTIKD